MGEVEPQRSICHGESATSIKCAWRSSMGEVEPQRSICHGESATSIQCAWQSSIGEMCLAVIYG